MADLFFNAAKNKYRFQSKRGNLTAEQLFDLPLEELDEIYGQLNAKLDKSPLKSLLAPKKVADVELEEKIDIVVAVYDYKEKIACDRQKAAERRQQKQTLLDILAKKKAEALENLSEEELLKKLQELGETV